MIFQTQNDITKFLIKRHPPIMITVPHMLCPDKDEHLEAQVCNGSLYSQDMETLLSLYCPDTLHEVSVHNSVKKIDSWSVSYVKLNSFLSSNVEEIADHAFNSVKINQFIGEKSLHTIKPLTFNSSRFYIVDLSETLLEALPIQTFNKCNIKRLILPKSLQFISTEAFVKCRGLKSIDIGNITCIENGAFQGCLDLRTIVINFNENAENDHYIVKSGILYTKTGKLLCVPAKWNEEFPLPRHSDPFVIKDVTEIEHFALSGCRFQNIVVSEGVKHINDYAFQNNEKLTSITLPDSLSSIGPFAFSGCAKLQKIRIPKNVHTIDSGTFQYCSSLKEIIISGDTRIITDSIPYCRSLSTITVETQLSPYNENALLELLFRHVNKIRLRIPSDFVFKHSKALKNRIDHGLVLERF